MSPGLPIMHQSWGTLLSMHWPVPAASLRPLIIDTFDVGREAGISAAAPLSERVARAELQYVHLDGMPGVWYFSLDANNPVAAWGHGRPSPEGDPLLHQQGEPLFVSVWPPARVR